MKVKEDFRKHVINKAIAKFDEENGLHSHKEYDLSVRENAEEWTVYFDGKTKLPGNHAITIIIKRTGEMNYFKGE